MLALWRLPCGRMRMVLLLLAPRPRRRARLGQVRRGHWRRPLCRAPGRRQRIRALWRLPCRRKRMLLRMPCHWTAPMLAPSWRRRCRVPRLRALAWRWRWALLRLARHGRRLLWCAAALRRRLELGSQLPRWPLGMRLLSRLRLDHRRGTLGPPRRMALLRSRLLLRRRPWMAVCQRVWLGRRWPPWVGLPPPHRTGIPGPLWMKGLLRTRLLPLRERLPRLLRLWRRL